MRKLLLSLFLCVMVSNLFAKGPDEDSLKYFLDELKKMDSIESTMNYQKGKIEFTGGMASINVPDGFRFLGPTQAKYVIEEVWGNPPSGESYLGMLLPASKDATGAGGYAFIIQFEEMGFVKDSDADKINYDDLLKDMQESSTKENIERAKMGIFTMDLVGWAAKPYYDKERKVLHWAKEYKVSGEEDNTLNYDIRVLGRKGVLVLQAVAGMDQLDSVNAHINDVLGMVSFNDGHRYADFDSNTDEVAAWTVGGLVAGKVLAKVGFFGVILKFLKFIIIGIGLLGGAIWRFVSGRKKKEEEYVYQPQRAPDSTTDNNPPV